MFAASVIAAMSIVEATFQLLSAHPGRNAGTIAHSSPKHRTSSFSLFGFLAITVKGSPASISVVPSGEMN